MKLSPACQFVLISFDPTAQLAHDIVLLQQTKIYLRSRILRMSFKHVITFREVDHKRSGEIMKGKY